MRPTRRSASASRSRRTSSVSPRSCPTRRTKGRRLPLLAAGISGRLRLARRSRRFASSGSKATGDSSFPLAARRRRRRKSRAAPLLLGARPRGSFTSRTSPTPTRRRSRPPRVRSRPGRATGLGSSVGRSSMASSPSHSSPRSSSRRSSRWPTSRSATSSRASLSG